MIVKKLAYYSNLQKLDNLTKVTNNLTVSDKNPSTLNDVKTIEDLFYIIKNAEIPYKEEQNAVYYDGRISPVMLVGEAPGEEEVIQGKPFVGRSGKLLQEMLDAIGLKRSNIYVTNVVVWRPPQNRTPLPEEINIMRPYLLKHIELVRPQILILVGGVARRCFFNDSIAISRVRGVWQASDLCANVMAIYHPSFLLRSRIHKKETWHDIMEIRQRILNQGLSSLLDKDCWIYQ